MQLRGILLHPSLQAIARAAVAAVMHITVQCVLAMVVIDVELFFVFEFFSFVKHFSLSLIVTQVVTLSKSCYTLA